MHLSDFDHFRNTPAIKFKEEEVDGRRFVTIAYMIGNKDLWEGPMALETRGSVFDAVTGECVCRPFEKFFNLGERADTSPDIVARDFVECYEKRDGSMVTPVLVTNDKVMFKTKKSFFSDVANLANELAPPHVLQMSWYLLQHGITPIWEFTHPDARIVIDYDPAENFTLIAARVIRTGEYLPYDNISGLYAMDDWESKVKAVRRYDLSWDQICQSVEKDSGIEGYVLLLKDGRRVKYKTAWYLSQHRLLTDVRIRDIAEAVVDETLDDFKSSYQDNGYLIDDIEKIENQVVDELWRIRSEVNTVVQGWIGETFKDAAIALKGSPLFSLIMSELRGKEPNYIKYWKENYLKNYSLRSLKNANF